ncbi:MAG TPA: hypothetical protein DDW49_00605 [Deltaproteobacteria bacterium]|nr:MAG: hypothetical protein A2048_06375 [Deltaproteobacteria bacterium GWA2_45_12]HBF11884.1 hypothetical protein [Deltaproteobacteria bacterium]
MALPTIDPIVHTYAIRNQINIDGIPDETDANAFQTHIGQWGTLFNADDQASIGQALEAYDEARNAYDRATALTALGRTAKFINPYRASNNFAEKFYLQAIANAPSNPRPYLHLAYLYAEIGKDTGDNAEKEKAVAILNKMNQQKIDFQSISKSYVSILSAHVYFALNKPQETIEQTVMALQENPSSEDVNEAVNLLGRVYAENPQFLKNMAISIYQATQTAEPAKQAWKTFLYNLPDSIIEKGDNAASIDDSQNYYRAARELARVGTEQLKDIHFKILYAKATRELAGVLSGSEDIDEMPDLLYEEAKKTIEEAVKGTSFGKEGKIGIPFHHAAIELAWTLYEHAEHLVDNRQASLQAQATGLFGRAESLIRNVLNEDTFNVEARNVLSWVIYSKAKQAHRFKTMENPYWPAIAEAKTNHQKIAEQYKDSITVPEAEYVGSLRVLGWSVTEHGYTLVEEARDLMLKADMENDAPTKDKLIKDAEKKYAETKKVLEESGIEKSLDQAEKFYDKLASRDKRDYLYIVSRYYFILGRTLDKDAAERAFALLDPKLDAKKIEAFRDQADQLKPTPASSQAYAKAISTLERMNTPAQTLENKPGMVEYALGYQHFRAGLYVKALPILIKAYEKMVGEWNKKEKIYKFLAMSLRNAQFMDREGFRTLQNENPEIKSEIDRLFRQTGNLSATGNNNTDGIVLSITPPKEPPPKKPVYPGLRDVNL